MFMLPCTAQHLLLPVKCSDGSHLAASVLIHMRPVKRVIKDKTMEVSQSLVMNRVRCEKCFLLPDSRLTDGPETPLNRM